MTLDNIATQFRNFRMYEQHANLVVVGHADVRGPRRYDQALSERRAALVSDYLISKGIPADEIKMRAQGKDKQMDVKAVETLQSRNDQKADKWMVKSEKTTWLAYNRRADLVLEPTGRQSATIYPTDASDTRIVWQRREPPLKKVEMVSNTPATSVQQARATNAAIERYISETLPWARRCSPGLTSRRLRVGASKERRLPRMGWVDSLPALF